MVNHCVVYLVSAAGTVTIPADNFQSRPVRLVSGLDVGVLRSVVDRRSNVLEYKKRYE